MRKQRWLVTGFPAKWRLRNERHKFHTDNVFLPTSGYSFWLVLNQSEALPRSAISMEFPRSFVRRHDAKQTTGDVKKWRLFSQAIHLLQYWRGWRHKSTHLSRFLYCLYTCSHGDRKSTIVLDHECMWRFAGYYWNIAWWFGFLCTALFLCIKKWKTFINPVPPKSAQKHKPRFFHTSCNKNSEKQDMDVTK